MLPNLVRKMTDSYETQSTSSKTAQVQDIWLNQPDDVDLPMTRKVLRVELVDNMHSEVARVKACICHQKRHSKKSPWENVDSFNLAHLKAGQEVRLQLGLRETHHLWTELERLHQLAAEGVPRGVRRFIVVDQDQAVIASGSTREIIQQLVDCGDDDLWRTLSELQPNLFKVLALTKLHEVRERAVTEFDARLVADDWDEAQWQGFFEANSWIFGYGLTYRFLSTLQAQPNYGGTTVGGTGGQRGDFLLASEAERRFTVLVEIKKPSSLLVADKEYRNKVHLLGAELVGGVSQLQANCRTWELKGAQDEENRERLEGELQSYTIIPKGILIVGHTRQLDRVTKRTTFELFRRNLHNPEIVTFDELLMRSRFLLLNEKQELARENLSEGLA